MQSFIRPYSFNGGGCYRRSFLRLTGYDWKWLQTAACSGHNGTYSLGVTVFLFSFARDHARTHRKPRANHEALMIIHILLALSDNCYQILFRDEKIYDACIT